MKLFGRSDQKRTQASNRPRADARPLVAAGLTWLVRGVWAAGALVAVIGGWQLLTNPEILPMRQVVLEAPLKKVSAQEVYQVVQPLAQGGFFNVDVASITEAVATLPWVDHVTVRRVWPDALQVTVIEQQPLARWSDGGLVNVRGERFVPDPASYPAGLPELAGPETTMAQMTTLFKGVEAPLQNLGVAIKRMTLTPRRAWELELNNGIRVVLGRADAEMRLQRLVRFYPELAARADNVQQIDMRYTNGFAVKWRHLPQA